MSFLVAGSIAAGGLAIQGIGALATSKNRKAPEREMMRLAEQQKIDAGALKGKLDAQGRPVKDAAVNRLSNIYDLASQGMTDQQMGAATNNLNTAQATSMRDLSDIDSGLRGIGRAQAQTADAMTNLAVQDANMAQSGMINVGGQLATAEQGAQDYNELLPYEQMLAEYQGLLGASQQNKINSLNLTGQRASNNQQMANDIGGAITNVGLGGITAGLTGGSGGSGSSGSFGTKSVPAMDLGGDYEASKFNYFNDK